MYKIHNRDGRPATHISVVLPAVLLLNISILTLREKDIAGLSSGICAMHSVLNPGTTGISLHSKREKEIHRMDGTSTILRR
jgi:DNA-binding CsgD family transcriptional regulator